MEVKSKWSTILVIMTFEVVVEESIELIAYERKNKICIQYEELFIVLSTQFIKNI